MLGAYRVLDLTDERGQLCGHTLASLGAEVIAVEPPGGARSRRLGPYWHDEESVETSLQHWAYNRGKRSVVLDLTAVDGRDALVRLAAGADVLIESAGPGFLASLGLGYDDLAAVNPALIYASISPFGHDGPKANWAASDLTLVAAGGQAWLTGDHDRPPLRITVPQAHHHAAADAACGVLLALAERQRSGRGQHVDASVQQSVLQTTQSMVLAHALGATQLTRRAGGVRVGPLDVQLMWPCLDGYISCTFLFGAAIGPFSRNLMEWVHEEGCCSEADRDKDWIGYTNLLLSGEEPISEYERLKRLLDTFFLTKTKAELLDAALTRRLLIAPITTIEEVVQSPHFAARDVWEDVDQGACGTVRYPGAMAKLTATPLRPLTRPPALGEHTAEVLAEAPRQPALRSGAHGAAGVGAGGAQVGGTGTGAGGAGAGGEALPLAGLKVLDLAWVMAGPAASRVLTDHGATVVRVESLNHLDTARTLQPFRDDGSDIDGSGLFNNMNAGKLGLALDLAKPAAREVLLDLVRWADVVVESFSPRAMRSWGLDYETLRQVKPDLVMASSCLLGQDGPWSSLAGFGTMAAAISGWFNITGWPDRAPSGPFSAYTDYASPRLFLCCILAALEHRRTTGEGQYIDLSQAEAALHFLTPAVLDYTVNGRNTERAGNDDRVLAPQGVYAAAGEERWVAISCTSDDAWRALADLVGRPDLAGLSAAERRERRRELDEPIAAWTASRSSDEIEQACQARGIAAHRVNDSEDCVTDPQLVARRHFVEVPHATQGTTWVEGNRFVLSRTPGRAGYGGPGIGEHTWEVLSEILGYDDDRVADLAAAELLE